MHSYAVRKACLSTPCRPAGPDVTFQPAKASLLNVAREFRLIGQRGCSDEWDRVFPQHSIARSFDCAGNKDEQHL